MVGGESDQERMELRNIPNLKRLRYIFEDIFANAANYRAVFVLLSTPGNWERVQLSDETPHITDVINTMTETMGNTSTPTVLTVRTSMSDVNQEEGCVHDLDIPPNLLVLQALTDTRKMDGFADFYGSPQLHTKLKQLRANDSILESVFKANKQCEAKNVRPLFVQENGFTDFQLGEREVV